jgi:hypothetical protein
VAGEQESATRQAPIQTSREFVGNFTSSVSLKETFLAAAPATRTCKLAGSKKNQFVK